MNAAHFLFPVPRKLTVGHNLPRPRNLQLEAEDLSPALLADVHQWLQRNHLPLARRTRSQALVCEISNDFFAEIIDREIRREAYELTVDGERIVLRAAARTGMRHAILSLTELWHAAEKGAEWTACRVLDYPVFSVRGVQIDMAREFFPPLAYLKRVVDRLERLKINTLWLYLENRFHAPGLEDLSPTGGMTPATAAEISAYAQDRGIDVVPATNVLSHMEGWFRLQRYCSLCDGHIRSYPVLTRPEVLELVLRYIDALIDAFPSENFHAGLDELLFTGANPEAAKAIEQLGKAEYFAQFAEKVIRHIQQRGKKVWMWDDMVLGKNVHRKEGFNEQYRQALNRIPRDVIMVHWYYWTNADGQHAPIMARVAQSGRPFVVAPAALGVQNDYADFSKTLELQAYMAGCGQQNGAFGLVNTHWESRCGHFFESHWPHLAVAAGFAWTGAKAATDRGFASAFSFNVTGGLDHELTEFLGAMSRVQSFLQAHKIESGRLRNDLYRRGPHFLWRYCSPLLSGEDRRELRTLLADAQEKLEKIPNRDGEIKKAFRVSRQFFQQCIEILDGFDTAYRNYHQASLAQAENRETDFSRFLHACYAALDSVGVVLGDVRKNTVAMQRRTGHTPYDSYALKAHRLALRRVPRLIKKCVKRDLSLPYFEKLLFLPNAYFQSNIEQLEIQNTFHSPFAGRGSEWLD